MAFKFNPFTGNFDDIGNPSTNFPTTSVTTTPVTATENNVHFVNTTTAKTINLPATHTEGNFVHIKDISGSANTNNITVSGNGSNIDGSASQLITSNYGSLMIVSDGTNWFLV